MFRSISVGLFAMFLLVAAGCGDKTKTSGGKTTDPTGDPDSGAPEDPPMDISRLPQELQALAVAVQPAGGIVEIESSEEGEKRVLYLSNTQNTDSLLAEAKKFPSITHLYLTNSSVTDAGLDHVADMENVVYLNLDSSGQSTMQLSDSGLKHLEFAPKLKRLTLLGNNSFSNQAIDALKEAKGGGDNLLVTQVPR